MFDPTSATADQHAAWRIADRYSFKEILALADHTGFSERRGRIWAQRIRTSLRHVFRPGSGLSARELAFLMRDGADAWASEMSPSFK